MPRSKHILPFFLEGEVQEYSGSTDTSWNGLTSFVDMANTVNMTFTVGKPTRDVPGALLSIANRTAADCDVSLGDLALDANYSTIALDNTNNSVLLLWTNEKWAVLSVSPESQTGGTMTQFKISGDDGTEATITQNETVRIHTGDGLSSVTTNTDDSEAVTISFDNYEPNFKTFTANVDFSAMDGSGTTFTAGDVLDEIGALNVTSKSGVTATKILIHDVIVNVETAAGEALDVRVDVSSDSALAVNDAMTNNHEIAGAGITAAYGATAGDFSLNTAGVTVLHPEVTVDLADVNVYIVAETALAADATSGVARIQINYSII